MNETLRHAIDAAEQENDLNSLSKILIFHENDSDIDNIRSCVYEAMDRAILNGEPYRSIDLMIKSYERKKLLFG